MAPDLGNVAHRGGGGASSSDTGKKRGGTMTPGQEKLTAVIFGATILGIMTCAILKVNTWYPACVGAMALVLTGVINDREAIKAMSNPVIFITIGTMPLSTALKTTGADVLLADTFNNLSRQHEPLYDHGFHVHRLLRTDPVCDQFRSKQRLQDPGGPDLRAERIRRPRPDAVLPGRLQQLLSDPPWRLRP